MSITRWDPFAEMMSLRDAMMRLMEDAWVRPSQVMGSATRMAPMDVYETPHELVVRAALPGVTPDQVNITFEQGTLTIKGSTPAGEKPAVQTNGTGKEEGVWHLRELPYGNFSRSIRLPDMFDPDKAEASFENGILTIRLPRTEQAKPRQIPVRSGTTISQ